MEMYGFKDCFLFPSLAAKQIKKNQIVTQLDYRVNSMISTTYSSSYMIIIGMLIAAASFRFYKLCNGMRLPRTDLSIDS